MTESTVDNDSTFEGQGEPKAPLAIRATDPAGGEGAMEEHDDTPDDELGRETTPLRLVEAKEEAPDTDVADAASAEGADSSLIDEVFETLFGSPGEAEPVDPIIEHIERASHLVSRQVRGFALALIQHMEDDPSSIRALEGLIVLGLAHPQVLERLRIPIAEEGRRLALLLESRGTPERAQSLLEILAERDPEDGALDQELNSMMRRTGNADRLIERYLERADESIADGRPMEAIPWLQEVLMIDRNRRDVGRMIRDLRFQEQDGVRRRRVVLRRSGWFVVGALLVAALVWREVDVGKKYAELPSAKPGDLASIQARLTTIRSFQRRHIVWHGVLTANRERVHLRTEALKIELRMADEASRARTFAPPTTLEQAEQARLRARLLVENRDFEAAIAEFGKALELAPADWEFRGQIETDIRAVESHLGTDETPNRPGSN